MSAFNALFHEANKVIVALSNTDPSSSTPRRVSLKAYERCTAIISVLNATTVTGSAITLWQGTDIANADSNEKALGFTTVYENLDVVANPDTLTATAVSGNTFTTLSTNSKEALYVIEVDPSSFDEGFDIFRVGTGNGAATTLTVIYVLSGAKYSPPIAACTN